MTMNTLIATHTNEKNIQIQIIIMKNLVQFKMKREKQTKRK